MQLSRSNRAVAKEVDKAMETFDTDKSGTFIPSQRTTLRLLAHSHAQRTTLRLLAHSHSCVVHSPSVPVFCAAGTLSFKEFVVMSMCSEEFKFQVVATE